MAFSFFQIKSVLTVSCLIACKCLLFHNPEQFAQQLFCTSIMYIQSHAIMCLFIYSCNLVRLYIEYTTFIQYFVILCII